MLDDLRYSFRLLAKNPGISAAIILILGLGVGLNTVAFSFLETTVTNPFPFPDAQQLVDVVRPTHQRLSGDFNYPAFAMLRDNNEIFADVAGYRDSAFSVVIEGQRASIWGAEVTAGAFELLGVQPLLGRPFTHEEEGPSGAPVAIISHDRWQTWFGSDPEVLGRSIELDGTDRTIVGVMPSGFTFYQPFNAVWVPLPVDATTPPDDLYRFSVVGRVRRGLSRERAQAAITTLGAALGGVLGEPVDEAEHLPANQAFRLAALDEGLRMTGRVIIGTFLQVTAGLVMVVVCANLGGLLFTRGVTREREIALRRALGASRFRLMRQILTENMLLAFAGAAAGVLVAYWGYGACRAVIPLLSAELRLDTRVLTFAIGLATTAVLLFGSRPALALSRTDSEGTLHERFAGASGPRHGRRWQGGLTIVQVAFSLILLVGASLALRSALALDQVDPGFDAEAVFEVHLSAPNNRFPDDFHEAVLRVADQVASSPAIEAVAWRSEVPPEVAGRPLDRWRPGFIETREGPSSLAVRGTTRRGPAVPPGYFRAFGLSVLRGRTFDDDDGPDVPLVAVLSEAAAQRLWPDDDVIGKQFRFPGATAWLTVIGVVSNVTSVSTTGPGGSEFAMWEGPWPDVYLAASQYQYRPSNNVLWVRPAVAVSGLSRVVRAALAENAPGYGVALLTTVWESEYEQRLAGHRTAARILAALGAIAVLLAALGTYSVVSYAWALRAREVGVRVALGATKRDVFGLVLRDSQKPALLGVLAGSIVSLAIYRLAAGFFFGISSWDPISYVAVSLLLLAVAGIAGLNPARRATRTDPIEVLRQQ